MKRRSLGELSALLAILVPGGVGVVVVARTLLAYWRRDWPATLIVLAIGAALLLGLAELLARQLRAVQLERELRALPARPTEATLDSASPLLAAMLRARLEQVPPPSLGDGIAPFLTGLLVMLGLLGTLLGLFQTVHGAGNALTSSADIDALRRSLSAPIDGLTRSFGCSAAGISASAMLGLAVALARRREGRALRAVYAYASGPLRALSPIARQTRALELIATQGRAMPEASTAIQGVGEQLGALSEQLVALQQSALKAQQRAFSDLLASVHSEFTKAAGETGKALHARVSPLLEQMAQRSSDALTAQAAALAEVTRDVTREIERDTALRRDEAAEAMHAMRARLDEAERARASAHAKELEVLTDMVARSATDSERREQDLSARWQELSARLDAAVDAGRERDAAQLAAARNLEEEHLRRLDAQLSAARDDEAARLQRIDAQLSAARASEAERLRSLDAQVLAAREREGSQLAQLDALSTRVGAELERLSVALSTQLEQRLASERNHDERAERAFTQLQAAAGALEQGVARQENALEQLVERLPPLFNAAAESSQQAAQQRLSELVDLTEQRITGVSKLLSDEQSQRADSARLLDERAHTAFNRVDQSAAVLDAAITRQGSGLEGLIDRIGTMLPQLADAAQSGAANTLARLGELAEQQAARFLELEATLERRREGHALGLADQLATHASELEGRLAKASGAVQEAAAIWQASSAEMQAVAELFASSVERQREASDAWLESLGEVEGAVERAGRHAARDALTDQLASTQEVFARQLEFQRELFEQLRTLRGGQSRGAHGENREHDVSV